MNPILKISLLSLIFTVFSVGCSTQKKATRLDYIYSVIEHEPVLKQILLRKDQNVLSKREVPVWRAIGYLGTPYKFGANSTNELDCSAFMQQIFKNLKRLKRTSYGQFLQLRKNAKMQPQLGDLVFFKTRNYNPVTHVGIMFSKTKFIHASTGKGIISVGNLMNSYWRKRVYAYADPFKNQI